MILLLLTLLHWGSGAAVRRQEVAGGQAWRVPPALQRYRRGLFIANTSDSVAADITCPYKVMTEGKPRNICFRTTDSSFRCDSSKCKVFRSDSGSLLANVLSNSSVLLQWRPPQAHTLRGFLLNCSWNGTFTRFQCDNVHLGTNCRDYLLSNLHDNVNYRICLKTLYTNRTSGEECVEFTVEPVGMQDLVIAMTAVGGSICVMLVIICLLVAYITENLMHPAFTHPSAKRRP
ncbi:fibronectin type III domain-containing protein 10 [Xenopus laevis]|uniref:Fibronectin type III domain-containing protein 10 n=2 Tax=Xenopus laevis TaxID=8355 RepID=A0A974HCA5_XENLA|nr:fibronectin type III domain-containing protein 10 [Xenopus laevis]OCT72650.1 hypothetical protein XELAEV_18035633mg [Xenopus laevis]